MFLNSLFLEKLAPFTVACRINSPNGIFSREVMSQCNHLTITEMVSSNWKQSSLTRRMHHRLKNTENVWTPFCKLGWHIPILFANHSTFTEYVSLASVSLSLSFCYRFYKCFFVVFISSEFFSLKIIHVIPFCHQYSVQYDK